MELKEITDIDRMINTKVDELMKLRQLQSLSSSDNIFELENEINAEIDKLVDLKKQALKIMRKLSNNRYKLILEKRYILNETFEKISCDLCISWKWVHVLHKEALKEFNELMSKR